MRCLKGLTQKQHENVNGQLWSRVPKTTFTGKKRVVMEVCETFCVADTGAASKAALLHSMGIKPGQNMRTEERGQATDF